MKRITRAGFTLMEVFLVVTIMFLLFVSMILVIQNSVARQRYEDSLTSFKDFLQRQYDEVQNVVIDDKGLSDFIKECDKQTQRGEDMGRTNCYVVGRLLNFNQVAGASTVKVEQIVYELDGTDDSSANNELAYNDFILSEKDVTGGVASGEIKTHGRVVDNYHLEWSGKIYTSTGSVDIGPNRDIDKNLAVLIFRSPSSGTVRTYVLRGNDIQSNNLKDIFEESSLKGHVDLCVGVDGNPYNKPRAVRIHAGSANASAIEIMPVGADGVECQKR